MFSPDNGSLFDTSQEYLLDALGLSASADKDWPLFVSPLVLSLFGRIALFEQMESLSKGSLNSDTPRAVMAWKKTLQTLGDKALDEQQHDGPGSFFTFLDL